MSGAMLGTGCPYSTPLGLRLGLFPCPYPWGLAAGPVEERRLTLERE